MVLILILKFIDTSILLWLERMGSQGKGDVVESFNAIISNLDTVVGHVTKTLALYVELVCE